MTRRRPRMPTEIRQYDPKCADREHPDFTWLLKCDSCGQYRDRDEMYEEPYATDCLLCLNKRGVEWTSPLLNNIPSPAKPEPKKEKVYAAPPPKEEPSVPVVKEDTPEMAEVRTKMHRATREGDIVGFVNWQNKLRELQQGATSD